MARLSAASILLALSAAALLLAAGEPARMDPNRHKRLGCSSTQQQQLIVATAQCIQRFATCMCSGGGSSSRDPGCES